MDAELDDFASAMEVALTRDGQNEPSGDLPMGGNKHTNVGAATSAEEYLRVFEYIQDIPLLVFDADNGSTHISASVEFYATVSTGQAPPDGARLRVYRATTGVGPVSSVSVELNLVTPTGSYRAPVKTKAGEPVHDRHIRAGQFHDYVWSSASTAWHIQSPFRGRASYPALAKGKNASKTVTGVADSTATVYINVDGDIVTLGLGVGAGVSVSVSASTRYFYFSSNNMPPGCLTGAGLSPINIAIIRASNDAQLNCLAIMEASGSVRIEDAQFGGGSFVLSANENFYIPAFTGQFFR